MDAPVQGQLFIGKNRHPFAVLFFSLVTFGVYWLYWYYTINDEIRRHEQQVVVRPGIALLAQFVPVASLISDYNTATRIQRMEMVDGVSNQISPLTTIVLLFFFAIGYVFQIQSHLNAHWDSHRLAGSRQGSSLPMLVQSVAMAPALPVAQLGQAPAPVGVRATDETEPSGSVGVISEDGLWLWDGQRWVPNPTSPGPASPPG